MQRDIFTNTKINDLEQGAIFYGALSENYPNTELYGIIITPRCDISNNKVNHFNYLPVVPFEAWIINDFWEIFKETILKSLNNNLKSYFQNKNLSPSIIDKFSPELILKKYDKYFVKAKENSKFQELINGIVEISKIHDSPKIEDVKAIMKSYEKQAKTILTEINNNRNPNFHIIESWSENGKYNVILLREIRKISYNIGLNLHKGIEVAGLDKEQLNRNDINVQSELLYIEKVLKSPFVEHLIQRFTSNFSKIGVQDHFSELTNHLFNSYSN
ncbi:MAG: hypothetical protein GQ564_20685 [Bacteroidales bacterium]|nr:hypothetical protein [Bacteroidales bacterium]